MIGTEYRMDVRAKSFWISTFLLPVFIIGLGLFIGFLGSDSDAFMSFSKSMNVGPQEDQDISGMQVLGMITGVFLTIFVMIYGAQVFNKVKSEKTGKIIEVLVSCVSGRSVMMSKIISTGLVGITQMGLWLLMLLAALGLILPMVGTLSLAALLSVRFIGAIVVSLLYFVGGYVFYGSLFAAAGALTDRNNENQSYLTFVTMMLMVSFYIGIYATDSTSALATVCFYLPFTSFTVGCVQSVGGLAAWWQTAISLVVLYASAALVLSFAGKIYTSAVLLRGKKLGFKDLLVFLKSK